MPEATQQEIAREAKEAATKTPGGVQDPDIAEIAAEREKNARTDAEKASNRTDRDVGPQRAAVESAAEGEELTTKQAMDAAEWFLSPDPDEDVSTQTIQLRVGKPGTPREWVNWTVKSIDRERIQGIREQERKKKRNRRDVEAFDEVSANLRIATEGTLYPDLTENRGIHADPADALKARFAFKPGLIDQIAAAVISVTGYDDDDVNEIDAVKT